MPYIMVTTDNGTVVFKRHHTEYPGGVEGECDLLNDLSGAVLKAMTHFEDLRKKYRDRWLPRRIE